MSEPEEGKERRAAGRGKPEPEGEQSKKKRFDLTTPQVVAGGVATLTAATAASFLGVYGTIGGAAVMSVISTAGTAVTQRFIEDGRDKAKAQARKVADRSGRTAVRRARASAAGSGRPGATDGDPPDTTVARTMSTVDRGAPAMTISEAVRAQGSGNAHRPDEAEGTDRGDGADVRTWWQRYRVYVIPAVVVFVGVMIVILVFEVLTGRSLSDTVRGEEGASSPSLLGGTTQHEDPAEGVEPGGTPGTDGGQDPRQEDQDGSDGTEQPEPPEPPEPPEGTDQDPEGGVDPPQEGDQGPGGEQDGGQDGQPEEGVERNAPASGGVEPEGRGAG